MEPGLAWVELGYPEIGMALDNEFDKPRPPPGATVVHSHEEVVIEAARRAGLTWGERLAEARARGETE